MRACTHMLTVLTAPRFEPPTPTPSLVSTWHVLYICMQASHHAIKAVSPSLSVGGPATEEVMHVGDFLAALKAWGLPSGPPDFVSTHSYPTDTCNSQPDARTHLDCFTDAIIAAREQAAGHTFLMTEYVMSHSVVW